MNDLSINKLSVENTSILLVLAFSENSKAFSGLWRPIVYSDRMCNYKKADLLGGLVFISFRCIRNSLIYVLDLILYCIYKHWIYYERLDDIPKEMALTRVTWLQKIKNYTNEMDFSRTPIIHRFLMQTICINWCHSWGCKGRTFLLMSVAYSFCENIWVNTNRTYSQYFL